MMKPWQPKGRNMGKSMLKRFQGPEGRPHLIEALILQPLVRDNELAEVLARRMTLEEIPAGASLIEQGASDTDLFLIFEGRRIDCDRRTHRGSQESGRTCR